MHGFKCAGTTFSWILEKCFPRRVLYVESENGGDRLDWRRVEEGGFAKGMQAITSHLIDCPPPGYLARLKVEFIRNPVDRLHSAYTFERDRQKKIPPDTTYREYIEARQHTIISNFMTRRLSPQGYGGWESRQGWQLRPELIDFDRQDLFVGVVERFDESLVVLEEKLEKMGCPLDLSYPTAMNIGSSSQSSLEEQGAEANDEPLWLVNLVETDAVTLKRSLAALDSAINRIPDFDERKAAFLNRCIELRNSEAVRRSVRLRPANEWTLLGSR